MTTNSSTVKAAKTPRVSKKKAAAAAEPVVTLNNTETLEMRSEADEAIDALLNELDLPAESTAIVASTTLAHDEVMVDSAMLDRAVMGAEAVEASVAVATPSGVVTASATPTGDASDVVDEPVTAAAAAEPKKVAIPRKHYSNKADRLQDRMGTQLQEYSVLTLADAGVGEAELKVKMDETLAIIKAMNKKEQNWASKFIEYMAGKKSSLSEVTARIFKVLHKDGYISMGSEGNVFKDLVSKPYSIGAARAMGGNNIGMLKDLKVIIDGPVKGQYVGNPESLLLMKVNSMLFPAGAAAETSAA